MFYSSAIIFRVLHTKDILNILHYPSNQRVKPIIGFFMLITNLMIST